MEFIPQDIPDVVLIKPSVLKDDRGYFVETFRQDLFNQAIGKPVSFVQDNESSSNHGVLRGLHFQLAPQAQNKLVRVVSGEVLDVSVDIRQGSPTFGQAVSVVLNDKNKYQLFIPVGFAHGFVVLSESAIFAYKTDNYYSADLERGLAFDDVALNINWQLPKASLKLSSKDLNLPGLVDLGRCFTYGEKDY